MILDKNKYEFKILNKGTKNELYVFENQTDITIMSKEEYEAEKLKIEQIDFWVERIILMVLSAAGGALLTLLLK